ncbi:LPS-assembly protein LptD [Novosphingobium bradum]|uniref:LPS-assembly protein LptD n=1 Tax=Novosphingobium bradum TaxID=1737444 RepID=A0ABV7ITA0_9SPHN
MLPAPTRATSPAPRDSGPRDRWGQAWCARPLPGSLWASCAAALALLLAAPARAQAPVVMPAVDTPSTARDDNAGADNAPIAFEAGEVSYAWNSDVATATGAVVLRRSGPSGPQSVRADRVTWNRKTGVVEATGNIRLVDENGNQIFTDRVELTDELKAGAMQNLLIALRDGGRLAAATGRRDAQGRIVLERAAYSGCPVEDEDGCPRQPTWQVNARRVVYDPEKREIHFTGARLKIFGLTLMPLPGLAIASDGRPINGLLIPDIQVTANNGIQISDAWYQRLGANQDLAVTGYLFTQALPMVSARYRALLDAGALQVTGYATRSRRTSVSGTTTGASSVTDFRGYIAANGRFQFTPEWSVTASLRLASDRTFLRRYDINRDDRLRSTFELERIGPNSYFSLSGWATQTMRVGDRQGLVPVALPVIDWRKRLADPVLGGRIELAANSLAITRTAGQDTQRAFARAQWDLTKILRGGQVVSLTALARGDIYHSDQNALTATALYRGNPGWQGRAIAIGAVDVKWPLFGRAFGGTQVLTPRVQLVASPPVHNLAMPNEDSRAIDLEDSNLFALNRFPGYDRVEDGVRLTYGFDWQLDRPGWRVKSTLGQSYRLASQASIVPSGTGLADRLSDVVGRTEVRLRDVVKLTWRYRLDKDNLAIRRNEIDATIGSARTYAEIGYLRLNRDITQVEDLQDREELRAAGRVAFARNWSVFGSGVINLTNRAEDPTNKSDGFQPIRTRVGVAYSDDCIELALTWRRDYIATGDAGRGNTVQIHFALRNLGFR